MALEISADTLPLEQTLAALEHITSTPALSEWLTIFMFPYMQERVFQRFRDEGDDTVGAWQPLHDATNEIRQNLGFPPEHPINFRSGALYNFARSGDISLDPTVATLAMPNESIADSFVGPPGTDVAVVGDTSGGSDVMHKYMVAQVGLDRTPARPVLAVDAADAAFALGSLEAFIVSFVAALGGQLI